MPERRAGEAFAKVDEDVKRSRLKQRQAQEAARRAAERQQHETDMGLQARLREDFWRRRNARGQDAG